MHYYKPVHFPFRSAGEDDVFFGHSPSADPFERKVCSDGKLTAGHGAHRINAETNPLLVRFFFFKNKFLTTEEWNSHLLGRKKNPSPFFLPKMNLNPQRKTGENDYEWANRLISSVSFHFHVKPAPPRTCQLSKRFKTVLRSFIFLKIYCYNNETPGRTSIT